LTNTQHLNPRQTNQLDPPTHNRPPRLDLQAAARSSRSSRRGARQQSQARSSSGGGGGAALRRTRQQLPARLRAARPVLLLVESSVELPRCGLDRACAEERRPG
jgi:hypothetical protein